MNQSKLSKKSILLYTLPAIIIFAIIYLIRGIHFQDDAYIYYRYAENWAAGYGPVFNVGEYVEGYSNLLWVALLAVGSLFSYDIASFAPYLNLLIGVMCIFLISRISGFLPFSKPRLMAIILPLFCALSYEFYYYGAAGMDTLLFSLVLMLCIISLYNNKDTGNYLLTFPLLFLLIIVRTEGFVHLFVLLAVVTFFIFREHKKVPKQLLATIFLSAGLIVLLFVVRYTYYGEWVSTPVISKGYATHSLKAAIFHGDYEAMKNFVLVILSGLKYNDFFFFLGAWIPFVVLLSGKNRNDILLWMIASSIALNVLVSVWAGGDYMPFKRRFLPLLPLTIIFVAWGVDSLLCRYWRGSPYKKAALSTAGILMLVLWMGYFIKPAMIINNKEFHAEDVGRTLYLREVGTLLRGMPVSTTLLSQMQGKIAYYAGPNVYVRDILGITNIHNAKYGNEWGFNWGRGACGRTDFTYSFTTPFDIFNYNSTNMHKKFIFFCKNNPSLCSNYRFFKKEEWIRSEHYIIANINHPIATALEEKFSAIPLPIDEKLKDIIQLH